MDEPILREEDLMEWEIWKDACLLHAKTAAFQRRLDRSASVVAEMEDRAPEAVVSWSMGKDSTAMTHLVCEEMGITKRCVWRMDDLCFPGERDYAATFCAAWSLEMDVVVPYRSKREAFAAVGITDPGDVLLDGRKGLDSFKGQMAKYWDEQGHPGYYVGLRADESRGRRMNRRYRGMIYPKGQNMVCQPLADWTGQDVFAYLFSRDIEPFGVYKCCAGRDPTMIRLGGFLPAAQFVAQGEIAWLRRYYPSVYGDLLSFMPKGGLYV